MRKATRLLITLAFAGAGATAASAQMGPGSAAPLPGTGDASKISQGNQQNNAAYNQLIGAADTKSTKKDGKSEKVLIKDVQYDHLGMEVLHVDFARVSLDEKVEITVELELKGTPKGEADGGVLTQLVAMLELECLVTDIPDVIRHNVSDMGIDSDLLVKDLKLPPGVRCLQDEDLMLAQVREIEEEESTPAEGESAEPEVIGRKPEDEAAAGAEAK